MGCLGKHFLRQCSRKKPCPRPGCRFSHHQLLHDDRPQVKPSDTPRNLMIARHGETHNQVVAVVLRFGTQERLTYALLDSGSSVSMIRTDLARELGMSGPPSTMTIAWTDSVGKSIKTEQLIG